MRLYWFGRRPKFRSEVNAVCLRVDQAASHQAKLESRFMDSSIFAFIWKFSRREQIFLLFFTVFTVPFLYATLELPKPIINDAIGASDDSIQFFSV